MDEVKAVTDFATVKTMEKEEAKKAGLYEVIGAAIDDAYIAELKKLVVHQDAINQVKDTLKIVYLSLIHISLRSAQSRCPPDILCPCICPYQS